jgi:hypothetical protein
LELIIRLQKRRAFVSLPNAVFKDRRISPEAKGALGYLASLPEGWEVRPNAVLAALQHEGPGRQLGREKLYRIFQELIAAGYMARTAEQERGDFGQFGPYVYIVGSEPEFVAEEAAAIAESEGVAFLPQSAEPCAAEPCAAKPTADKERRIYIKNKARNSPSPHSPESAEPSQDCRAMNGVACGQSQGTATSAPSDENAQVADRRPPAPWQQSRDRWRIAAAKLNASVAADQASEADGGQDVQFAAATRRDCPDERADDVIAGDTSDDDQVCDDGYEAAARAAGCVLVYENSEPMRRWLEHREAGGMALAPPMVTVTVDGVPRRGAYLPSLYPPRKPNAPRAPP